MAYLPKGGHGGKRSGAGRPARMLPDTPELLSDDPRALLVRVMTAPESSITQRLAAAKILMPYVHGRVDGRGKKVTADEQAAVLAKSPRFKPSVVPLPIRPAEPDEDAG